jgi:hypothetical protein
MSGHGPRDAVRRRGEEPFRLKGRALPATLLSFWQWSASDLLDNTMRGKVAEYIVGLALSAAEGVRDPWAPFDLTTPSGLKVEVKSASRWQSWHQKEPSRLSFGVQPTHEWSRETGEFAPEQRRQADVYVFAVLDSDAKAELDPMDLGQWSFLVLAARTLDERVAGQKQVGLDRLREFGALECEFEGLAAAVAEVGKGGGQAA